jgi:hypothetical protein
VSNHEYDDGNDLLNSAGKGTPWAKWPVKGATVTGRIIDTPSARQSTDIEDRTPKFWPDGTKMMEVSVRIATDERDADIEEDDGTRQVVLPVGTSRFKAVQAAMKTAGVKALEPGGVLTITYTHDGPKAKGSKFAPKEYSATYTAPAQAALAGDGDALGALAGLVK